MDILLTAGKLFPFHFIKKEAKQKLFFQFINVIIFTNEAIFYYIPSFYIVLVLTLWEGLLGGGSYVNTFYAISNEVPEDEKQFSLACTSFSDSIGISLAGVFAIFVHNAICKLPKPNRLEF